MRKTCDHGCRMLSMMTCLSAAGKEQTHWPPPLRAAHLASSCHTSRGRHMPGCVIKRYSHNPRCHMASRQAWEGLSGASCMPDLFWVRGQQESSNTCFMSSPFTSLLWRMRDKYPKWAPLKLEVAMCCFSQMSFIPCFCVSIFTALTSCPSCSHQSSTVIRSGLLLR